MKQPKLLTNSSEMSKEKKEILFLGIFFCLVFISRLILLLCTNDFHGVSSGRVLMAELILLNDLNPGEWFIPVHPPIHILFLVSALKIFNNPMVVPRLISLFFGSILIFPFFYSVKTLFERKTAIFSTIALGFYSMHIVYSVIATAATGFQFFLITSFWLCLVYDKNKKQTTFYLAAVFLAIASLCRYEGLLFIPLISFFFRKEGRRLGLFFLIAISGLSFWAIINYVWGSDPLLFLHTNDFTVPLQFNWIRAQGITVDTAYKILFWPKVLIGTLGWPMFLLGTMGALVCLKNRKAKAAVFTLLIVWTIFILRTVQEVLYLQPRYSITLGVLMIPFGIYMIGWILERMRGGIPIWVTLVVIWSMIPAIGNTIYSEPLQIPLFAKEVSHYMAKTVKSNDNIIMDHCGDEKYRDPIKVLSGVNPRRFILTSYLIARDGLWIADKDKFFKVLDEYNISMLIYSPKGDLGGILALESRGESSLINGFSFKLLYSYFPYMVYRVRKEQHGV